jgi:hypothetical protein
VIAGTVGVSAEWGELLVNEHQNFNSASYVPCYLSGDSGGSHDFSKSGLTLSLMAEDSAYAYGLYNKTTVSGHFYAEVDFNNDGGCGLALIRDNNGVPDFDNYTSLCFTTEDGVVWVSCFDRQNGVDNVYDYKGVAPASKYRYPLTEDRYSVNVNSTTGKMRIFHDDLANTWHFYYGIRKLIKGRYCEGWLELKPSPDWNPRGSSFYVCPYVRGNSEGPASVLCSRLRIMNKPKKDQDDRQTGFKAVNREIIWSGFSGSGIVITFGKHFPFSGNDAKFIFWTEANYVPGWHLSNQLFTMYEFVEQGLSVRGCEEPMGDRLLRWSRVEIVEDNAVRKTVHWHYVDANPEYKTNEEDIGTQIPEIDEWYTFYPDGVGIRKIKLKPKMDGTEFGWNELAEIHVTAGSTTTPDELLAAPALSLANLQGDVHTFHPHDEAMDRKIYKSWPQILFITHCKEAPDPFIVFSQSPDVPETYSYYKPRVGIGFFQTRDRLMTHFPINREEYDNDMMSDASWPYVIPTRNSLVSIGMHEGKDWTDHYKVGPDGRAYREWFALVGLAPQKQVSTVRHMAQTWLYPGTVTMLEKNCTFIKNDVTLRQLMFKRSSGDVCRFRIDPGSKGTTIVNPVFCIQDWDADFCKVEQDGNTLVHGVDFEYAESGSSMLVWVKTQSSQPLTFAISRTAGTR